MPEDFPTTGIRHADTAFAIARWVTKGKVSSAGFAVQDLIDKLIELGWTPPATDKAETPSEGGR